MLLSILHRTELHYSQRISESVLELRMAPRSGPQQTLRGFGLAVGPSVPLFEHVDWLGNRVHTLSVVDFHERIVILAHSAVETHRSPLLDMAVDPYPLGLRDHKVLDFVRFHGPVNQDDRLEDIARQLQLRDCRTAAELVRRVTQQLRDVLQYRKGVTTTATTVSDALDRGAGVCQDFAHVAIALLRRAGIPARYVSGYLYKQDEQELETHAWVETYLPSVGWVGTDPTHAELASDQHVAVAAGRSFADVPPNRGVFRGNAVETIRVAVTIDAINEVPRGLLAPRPAPIAIATYSDGPQEHREQIDYQQEQQQQ